MNNLCPTPHVDAFTGKLHRECIGPKCAIFVVTGKTPRGETTGACAHAVNASAHVQLLQQSVVTHQLLVHLAVKLGVSIVRDAEGHPLLPPLDLPIMPSPAVAPEDEPPPPPVTA